MRRDEPRDPKIEREAECVCEVILPTRSERDAQAVRLFFAALPLPVSLEYLGTPEQPALLIRGSSNPVREAGQLLEASFPKARVRLLAEDPAQSILNCDQAHFYQVGLAAPPYFPIRTWQTFADGDPVGVILSKLVGLSEGEALWLQFALHSRAQPRWLNQVQERVKLETQRGFVSAGVQGESGPVEHRPLAPSFSYFNGFFYTGLLVLTLILVGLYLAGQWGIALALLGLALGLGGVWNWLAAREDPWERADLTLVRQKVIDQDGMLRVTMRAAVVASTLERQAELTARLEAILALYSLSGGNRFRLETEPARTGRQVADPQALELSLEELSGLWHVPFLVDQAAPGLIGVNTVEMRSPHPLDVRGIFQIGEYPRPDGRWGKAWIGERALAKSMALFGKPGQGKSMLMIHLALASIQSPEHPCVVIVDPHGDLANFLMGSLPAEHIPRVRLLDVQDREFLLTFNPLEMHMQGLAVEAVAQLMVDIGRELWEDFWGPRMQIPLNRGVQALAAANRFHAPDDQFGLAMLAKIVGCSHEVRHTFLDEELDGSSSFREIRDYFNGEFRALSYSMREQIVQPVLSKAYRFREMPLLALLSCPKAMLDLGKVIAERQVLIVNTHLSGLGPEMSDFVGSLLLNLLMRAIARQGERESGERVPVRVLVDEFQTYTGVGWAEWEQQLRKWRGSVILGTQSLASLRATQGPELPGIITSGTASLFTFAVNGEDAEYLARHELNERAGGPSPETLTNLPPFHCFARLIREDGSPSQPFTLRTALPPPFQEEVAARVRALRKDYALGFEEALRLAQEKLDYMDRYDMGVRLSSTGSDVPRTRSVAGMEIVTPRTGDRDEEGDMIAPGKQAIGRSLKRQRRSAPDAEEPSIEDKALADAIAEDLRVHFGDDFRGEDLNPSQGEEGDEEAL